MQKYINRFHIKYTKHSNGCWEWTDCRDRNGYGVYRSPIGDRAHRFSALIAGIEIENKLICHTCDNPGCVNPDHLYAGTAKDNARDAVNRNRLARQAHRGPRPWKQGVNNQCAKLTDLDILKIKSLCKTMSQNQIAALYNINQSTVSRINKNVLWKHVT